MQEFTIKMSGYFDDAHAGAGEAVDLRGLESTNCYCPEESAAAVRSALESVPVRALHRIDTGDYHYLTYFFLERIGEPFCLLLVDNHSDDFEEEVLSCGNWVAHARRLPHWREGLPEGVPVYVSLDLDALDRDFFRTNWDQGKMTPDGLETLLEETLAGREVLGIDVCGGITASKGGTDEDFAVNRATSLRLEKFLERFLPD